MRIRRRRRLAAAYLVFVSRIWHCCVANLCALIPMWQIPSLMAKACRFWCNLFSSCHVVAGISNGCITFIRTILAVCIQCIRQSLSMHNHCYSSKIEECTTPSRASTLIRLDVHRTAWCRGRKHDPYICLCDASITVYMGDSGSRMQRCSGWVVPAQQVLSGQCGRTLTIFHRHM